MDFCHLSLQVSGIGTLALSLSLSGLKNRKGKGTEVNIIIH